TVGSIPCSERIYICQGVCRKVPFLMGSPREGLAPECSLFARDYESWHGGRKRLEPRLLASFCIGDQMGHLAGLAEDRAADDAHLGVIGENDRLSGIADHGAGDLGAVQKII